VRRFPALRRECVAGVPEKIAGGIIPPAICESFWGHTPRRITSHPVVATPVELAFGGQEKKKF